MAIAPYYDVEKACRDLIGTDPELAGTRIFIEADFVFAAESAPAVYIYAASREAPAEEQRLSAGRRTDWLLRIAIWCVEWHLESTERAAELRDDLMGRVEVALMRDRSLKDTCDRSWLEGGQFIGGLGEQGFLSAGEIMLTAKIHGTL